MVQFTVNNLEDTGAGSLRQAIEDANARSGKDEIIFEDSLSGGEINISSEALSITDSLSIEGLGTEQLTIRNSIDTLGFTNVDTFLIDDDTENIIDVEISQLTLVDNGIVFNFGTPFTGAAVNNRENLTISNSVISKSENFQSVGSGILNVGSQNDAELTLIDSTIRDRAIGIENGGKIEVRNSTISGNDGSGIANTDGIVNLSNSTISGNGDRSGNLVGGIDNYGGTLNISNSTITNNYRNFGGGGIYIRSQYDYDGNPIEPNVVITSSIIAGNRVRELAASPEEIDIRIRTEGTTFTSGGNNLIGVGGNTGFTDGVNGDLVGTADNPIDPQLTPLQDNGGNTQTQALLSDSPAIDTGSNPNDLEFDQRGAGFDRVVGSSADIGAVEFQDTGTLISIEATTPVAVEGDSNGVFTISRGEQTDGNLVVSLVIVESSTVNLDDYNLTGNNLNIEENGVTVTIPDGASSTDLVVEAVDDTAAEEEENLVIRLNSSIDYNIDGNNALATVTIAQNDFSANTVVTNTNDSGTGSLRQAIANTNLLEGTQTITFDPSVGGETITLTTGELVITDSVEIEGLENSDVTVSGNNNSRVFNVNDSNDENLIDVNISQITVTEGRFIRNDDDRYSYILPSGDAISNRENLTITNSTITNNIAETSRGTVFSYYAVLIDTDANSIDESNFSV